MKRWPRSLGNSITVVFLNAVVAVTLFAVTTRAAVLNGRCVSNCDCLSRFSECAPAPAGCGTHPLRYCRCTHGYVATLGLECKKAKHLGESCGQNSLCVDKYSTCGKESKVCECILGFKQLNDRCVSRFVKSAHSEACEGNMDCDFTQECISGVCTCLPGYSYSDEVKTCIESQIGNSCQEDFDCVAVANSECRRNICECKNGYEAKAASIVGKNVTFCSSQSDRPLAKQGEFCNENGTVRDWPTIYCEQGLTCTACPGWVIRPRDHVCVPPQQSRTCTVPDVGSGRVMVSLETHTDTFPIRQRIGAEITCDTANMQVVQGAARSVCDLDDDGTGKTPAWTPTLGRCESPL